MSCFACAFRLKTEGKNAKCCECEPHENCQASGSECDKKAFGDYEAPCAHLWIAYEWMNGAERYGWKTLSMSHHAGSRIDKVICQHCLEIKSIRYE